MIADLEPEEAVSRLEPALTAMRAAVRRFGGIVSREMGDGVSAVFGAPVADDNHAPLACHAAIDLVRRVAALGDASLQVRVALHSGLVVTSVIDSEFSRVYEMGGAAQHLAARLESVAQPGEIYVSEACQKLAEGNVQFEYLGRKVLRGFTSPVPVYRVTGASDLSSWRVRKARSVSRFVGRAPEIALLRRAADAVGNGAQTVCLTGEPGIGKSRLAHEFVRQLEEESWRRVDVECSPNLQDSPFSALKGMLRSVLDNTGAVDERDRMTDLWQGQSEILRAAVDTVLDLPVSSEQWDKLEASVRGRAISEAICSIVEALVRRQPTVLLIEDLHWIDHASASVMVALASLKTRNLLMIVTSRPHGVPDWINQSGIQHLTVRPLDESSGWAMLDAILGSSSTMFELKHRILRHTGSVPLFVEEVCRGLKESGALQGVWGDLALGRPADELGIPESVQGVIAARLDRLSRVDRALMQVAAAVGPRSTVATLRKVAALSESALQHSLGVLDRAELLVDVGRGGEGSYEIPHDMVRQVTYESMVERTRETIHTRILAALEDDESSRAEADTLCYHAMRAKDWPKAFGFGRSVARKCVARSAFADATSYFKIAMDALDRTPASHERETEAIDLRIEARIAFNGFGKVAEWLELGKQAVERANAIDDIGRKVAALTMRAAAQNFYDTPVEAIATGEHVVHLAGEWGDAGWLNLAEYGLGQAYFVAGHYLQAEQALERVCNRLMAPQASAPIGTTPQYLLLMCCLHKNLTDVALGEFDRAERFHQRAQEIADESDRPFDRLAAASGAGPLMIAKGNPAAAAVVLGEAVALAERHGVRLFLPILAFHRGMAYLALELEGAAARVLTDARDMARSMGYRSMELRASIYLGLALGRGPDADAALGMLHAAQNVAREQGYVGFEAEALLCEAMVTPATSDHSRARIIDCLRASIASSARNGAKPLLLKAETLLATMLEQGAGIEERELASRTV